MKTVCKKLLCLMLVAMMLVSAIPAAFAAGTEPTPVGSATCGATADGKHIWNPDTKVVVDPTCTTDGYEDYTCTTGGCGAHGQIVLPKLGHQFEEKVTSAATCTADGEKKISCTREGCNEEKTEKISALGHAMDNGTVTTAATCKVEGVKTYSCTNGDCDYTTTEVIPVTNNHNFVDGACTVCGSTDGAANGAFTVRFHYDDNKTIEAVSVTTGSAISGIPTAPKKAGYRFDRWSSKADGTGTTIANGETWYYGMPTDYYAVYSQTNDDGLCDLNVWVRFYVNGVNRSTKQLFTKEFDISQDNNMYSWLVSDSGVAHIRNLIAGYEGYQWEPSKVYYNYYSDEVETAATLKCDGDKNIYIKLYSKTESEAQVMLYVHKGKTATVSDIIEMNGYTAGDTVYLASVKTALKNNKYSYSAISNLYTDSEWEDLLDGMNSSGSNGVTIKDNGLTKIHVYLTNASTSSNADSSNPKTGDNITIAVTAMVLASAAFVALVEMKKRKMI